MDQIMKTVQFRLSRLFVCYSLRFLVSERFSCKIYSDPACVTASSGDNDLVAETVR